MTAHNLLQRLPAVRGRYKTNVPLSTMTWFAVGGPVDVLFRPADVEDLVTFLQNKPADVPVTILGVGSNILVRDGGLEGVLIRLGRGFSDIRIEGDLIHVGAGCLDRAVALACAEAGIQGLEFLVSIPGTMGGAVKMNAGAYGREMKDILVSVDLITLDGHRFSLAREELSMTYRRTELPEGSLVIGATLRGTLDQTPGSAERIQAHLQSILEQREASQPTRGRTGGSTFKNPGGPEGLSAWKLIDEAGCRGLQIGNAQVSEKHCNFLMNIGDCTASDLETLGDTIQQRVQEKTGVSLQWEIIRLGKN